LLWKRIPERVLFYRFPDAAGRFPGFFHQDPFPGYEVSDPRLVGIAWNQVQVKVIDGSTGGVAHVVADVVTHRLVDHIGNIEKIAGQLVQSLLFFGSVVPDILGVACGEDQQVPGIVRIEIYRHDKQVISVHRQIGNRGMPVTNQTEDTPVGFRFFYVGVLLEVEKVIFPQRLFGF